MLECPVCGTHLAMPSGVVENEIIDCGTCSAELEVLSLNPLSVEEAPEEQEDWGE
ncbi:MAG TPA: lysine biosynthesis protein LysW [Candidatus Marinimicrobia bacterium]|nr:lysine biosynthesis protein LysW [Candidatus Neomarinimicrobiota bacterium]